MNFLGGKLSKKKTLQSAVCAQILGLLLDGHKDVRGFRVPDDKATSILSAINEFFFLYGRQEIKHLESWVGKLVHLSYFSNHAMRFTYPLMSLQWLSASEREAAITRGHPMYSTLMECFNYWFVLLQSKKKILWSVHNDPKVWLRACSDSSLDAWAFTDYERKFMAGKFKHGHKENIATLELRALTNYIKLMDSKCSTGIIFLCDNISVVHACRRNYAKSISLKSEFAAYADLCERKSIRVVPIYVNTHKNLLADLGTRGGPLTAACLTEALANSNVRTLLDEGTFCEAILEAVGWFKHL